jgi:hypothetical protein
VADVATAILTNPSQSAVLEGEQHHAKRQWGRAASCEKVER